MTTNLLICCFVFLVSAVSVFAETTVDPSNPNEPHDTTLLKDAPDWESKEFKKEKQDALEKKAAEESAANSAPGKKKDRTRTLRKIQK